MTLSEFLLARIAEDGAAARTADNYDRWYLVGHTERCDSWGDMPGDCTCGAVARVLAECEAKRRIVELRYSWNLQAESAPEPPFGPILKTQVVTADTILRTLASVYADHPDYDPSWRA